MDYYNSRIIEDILNDCGLLGHEISEATPDNETLENVSGVVYGISFKDVFDAVIANPFSMALGSSARYTLTCNALAVTHK